jgi:hypothetical protein
MGRPTRGAFSSSSRLASVSDLLPSPAAFAARARRQPSSRRRCFAAAPAHGVVSAKHPKYKGCGLKASSFGLPAEGKAWWCAGCAKGHVGVVSAKHPKREDCGLKAASLGLSLDGKRVWWCGDCASNAAFGWRARRREAHHRRSRR